MLYKDLPIHGKPLGLAERVRDNWNRERERSSFRLTYTQTERREPVALGGLPKSTSSRLRCISVEQLQIALRCRLAWRAQPAVHRKK